MIKILLSMPKKGSRFTPLQNALVISPSRLNDNLIKLETMNMIKHLSPIERRHPLLPEYVFTDVGHEVKETLTSIHDYQALFPFDIYEKWTLLVLLELLNETKFNQIKKKLKITPKVLSQRLTRLMALQLIEKHVVSVNPMEIEYRIKDEWLDLCYELNQLLE